MKAIFFKHWRKIVLVAVGLPVLGFFALTLIIGNGVRGAVSDAQSRFQGDPETALISVAASEEMELSIRNRAIWALGQLGSSKAFPTLQSMLTGLECDHETKVCQKEVNKAVEACSGGVNIGAFVWRHGDLAVSGNTGGVKP